MILERTDQNNGYGCSCCRVDWEICRWIEKDNMRSFEEIINEAYTSPLEDVVGRRYEDQGKVLYGYRSDVYKAGSDVYVIIGNSKMQITRIGKELLSKEECIKKFHLSA